MFNKKEFEEFRKDFKEAVKVLESKYGVVIEAKRITYDDTSFKMPLEVIKGSKENKMKAEFLKYCHLFDIPKESLGKQIKANGKVFEIIGIDINKRKYCVKLKDIKTGSICGIPSEACLSLLEKQVNLD